MSSNPTAQESDPAAGSHDEPTAEGADKRRQPRLAYPYVQWLAPLEQGKIPPPSAFVEVRCRDISATGFSYLSETEPAGGALVVALDKGPTRTCLAAEVAHVTVVEYHGKRMFAVGCRYTGRPVY